MEIVLEKEKETKNKIRYQEVLRSDKPPIVGTLYVEKWFAGNADRIKIKIEKL